MEVRRIVTGQTPNGSAVVSDQPVGPITVGLMPGAEFHALWGSDTPASLPADGHEPTRKGWFPPPSGFRFGLVTIPPDGGSLPDGFDLAGAIAEVSQKLPGMVEVLEPGNPGMHTTDTVDFAVILSGEIYLELDNGEQTLVRSGDVVVQNGTRHAWRNKSDNSCVMAVALVGSKRSG